MNPAVNPLFTPPTEFFCLLLSGRGLQLVRVLFRADFLLSGTIVLFTSLPFITARTGTPTRSGVR